MLNDRGRPLSDGALLRTHTLAILEDFPSELEAAERDWDEILREGEQYVDRFLGAFYASYAGARAPKDGMFDAFRVQFSRFLPDERVSDSQQADEVKQFIGDLRQESELFARLLVGEWPYEQGAAAEWDRDRLYRLVAVLAHNLAFPLLLAVARRCLESRFVYLVLLLERFVFRYINVAGGSAAALSAIYYEHAKRVRETDQLDGNRIENQLRTLRDRFPSDEIFGLTLQDQLRYSTSPARNRLLKHFLTTLENHYRWYPGGARGKPSPTKHSVFDFKKVTLEHVYAQCPEEADPALEDLKHDLGNITLLDERDGPVAANAPFAEKKPIYENSQIDLTRELAQYDEWTPQVVRGRADNYAEMAKKIFII